MKEIYNWYTKNGAFDDELLKIMQIECFNKHVETAAVTSWEELNDILNKDKRFNDPRLLTRWWWIFDLQYDAIEKNLLANILQQIKDVKNPWAIVAIVQSITGLNCGFVGKGRKIVNNEITNEEVDCYGFIIKDNDAIRVEVYVDGNVAQNIVVGFAVFD